MTAALILARMSSSRFPGKVLAPFRGKPLLAHVVARAREVFPRERVVIATSNDGTDDPVAAYAACLDAPVFRGPLHDPWLRVRQCAEWLRADWIVRINADSPLILPAVLREVAERAVDPYDLVTTIAPRTLPRGQNPEVIRATALFAPDPGDLTSSDREHVTGFYHRHPERFRIRNIGTLQPGVQDVNLSVDTPDDLKRLEAFADAELWHLVPERLEG